MSFYREATAAFVALVIAAACSPASSGPVNVDADAVAIEGYDAVAYFTLGEATPGDERFEHTWQDARWLFSAAEHRDLFAADPERYAPRYGGYCAGGMARGRKARIDPEAWVIVDDRLYLNYSKKDRDSFAADPQPRIAEADRNWERMEHR